MKLENHIVGTLVQCKYCGDIGKVLREHSPGWLIVEFCRPANGLMAVQEAAFEPVRIVESTSLVIEQPVESQIVDPEDRCFAPQILKGCNTQE